MKMKMRSDFLSFFFFFYEQCNPNYLREMYVRYRYICHAFSENYGLNHRQILLSTINKKIDTTVRYGSHNSTCTGTIYQKKSTES